MYFFDSDVCIEIMRGHLVYGCLKDPSFVVPEEEGDLDEIALFA